MKWPWTRRIEAASKSRKEAEVELERVKDQWPLVLSLVAEAKYQRELNGWSSEIQSIFGGKNGR